MSSVDNITENLAATSIAPVAPEGANNVSGGEPINAAENEAVIAAAAEGRRLYIGNLAYATTEGELKSFFTGFSVYAFTNVLPLSQYANTHLARPPPSPPTLVPPAQLAMPSSTSPPQTKLRKPSLSSPANSSLTARSPCS